MKEGYNQNLLHIYNTVNFNIDNICIVGVKVQMYCLLAPGSQIECTPCLHTLISYTLKQKQKKIRLIGHLDYFHFKDSDSADSLRNSLTEVMERVF